MKFNLTVTVLTLLALEFPLLANKKLIDCNKGQNLNEAVADLSSGDTLTFTGVCNQNVLVATSGITLSGQGTAVISSPGPANDRKMHRPAFWLRGVPPPIYQAAPARITDWMAWTLKIRPR
jgi:hypothetical protein